MRHWKIYNHALIPTTAPHEEPHIEEINSIRGNWLFARYTTDFDCGYPTEWWYCIKDEPIDLNLMKSKQRCEIKKGLENCTVKRIEPKQYQDEIWNVFLSAYQKYKKVKHIAICKEQFIKSLQENGGHLWGCFVQDTLAAYGIVDSFADYANYRTLKYDPQYLKLGTSAALIYTTLYQYINTEHKKYIMNAERSIRHDSNIQKYLEKTFGFRKAYCQLHLIYKHWFHVVVKLLYPFRKLFLRFDFISFINDIGSILKQEEIYRTFH